MKPERRPKCITKFCRGRARLWKTKCAKCEMRAWRKAHPDKARFGNLRTRAKVKKLPFDLTLEWLNAFLAENGYDPSLHHIDRICVLGGYTRNNLQVLPICENIAKGNRERHGQAELL